MHIPRFIFDILDTFLEVFIPFLFHILHTSAVLNPAFKTCFRTNSLVRYLTIEKSQKTLKHI